jgi:excisionase family DNA binding protein
VLLLHAVAERQRWKAEYTAAQLAGSGSPPGNCRQLTIKLLERGAKTVEKYLTVSETAEYLNTSERFVRRLIAERRIAFHHVGRHVRFALSDIEAWLTTQRVEPFRAAGVRREWRRAS